MFMLLTQNSHQFSIECNPLKPELLSLSTHLNTWVTVNVLKGAFSYNVAVWNWNTTIKLKSAVW